MCARAVTAKDGGLSLAVKQTDHSSFFLFTIIPAATTDVLTSLLTVALPPIMETLEQINTIQLALSEVTNLIKLMRLPVLLWVDLD